MHYASSSQEWLGFMNYQYVISFQLFGNHNTISSPKQTFCKELISLLCHNHRYLSISEGNKVWISNLLTMKRVHKYILYLMKYSRDEEGNDDSNVLQTTKEVNHINSIKICLCQTHWCSFLHHEIYFWKVSIHLDKRQHTFVS